MFASPSLAPFCPEENMTSRGTELSSAPFPRLLQPDDSTTHCLTLLQNNFSMACPVLSREGQRTDVVGRRAELPYTRPSSGLPIPSTRFARCSACLLVLFLLIQSASLFCFDFPWHLRHGSCRACWCHGDGVAVQARVGR